MKNPADEIADLYSWNIESIKSIEVTSKVEFKYKESIRDPRVLPSFSTEEHYIETIDGRRYYETVQSSADVGKKLTRHYFNGVRCADALYAGGPGSDQMQVVIKKTFGIENNIPMCYRPIPLKYFYVGKFAVSNAMKFSSYMGSDRLLGRDCEVFLFPRACPASLPADVVYSFDRETGVPLKVCGYWNEQDRAENHPFWVWEANAFRKVHDHWIPTSSVETIYKTRDANSRHVESVSTHTLVAIEFDKDYAESVFWPKLEKTANVFDTMVNSFQRATVTSNQDRSSTETIRVPSQENTSRTGANISVLLGVACAVAALLIWWRYRR